MKQITVTFMLPELLVKDFTNMLQDSENMKIEPILVDTDEKSNLLSDCILAALEQKQTNKKHFSKTKN